MLLTTLPRLRCPGRNPEGHLCAGKLSLVETTKKKAGDVISGTLVCDQCRSAYPILAGIAVLVNDLERYLQFHVKGIAAHVKDAEIPGPYREAFVLAKSEIRTEFTEEDLESQRINALYYMNHYLSATKAGKSSWWRPQKEVFSPEIDSLIKNHWDRGPFAKIADWTKAFKHQNIIELGCGVGGLARVLAKNFDSYLGVDTSFASIALARHVYLGAPYSLPVQIPQDLYKGPLTGKVTPPKLSRKGAEIDFVVGELESLPAAQGQFDLAIVLNAIDMIEDPTQLPRQQFALLKDDGIAIHGCPYIWHKAVAENLRRIMPKSIQSSSAAIEHLYEKSGFKIFKNAKHLPWLFLKHFRQIEMYSVHLFAARKRPQKRR